MTRSHLVAVAAGLAISLDAARAQGPTFNPVGSPPPMQSPALVWGDYDADGDLDFAIHGRFEGSTGWATGARVYRNDGLAFAELDVGLPLMEGGDIAWGDFDGDGDLDLAAAGITNMFTGASATRVSRNDGGTFVDVGPGLPRMYGRTLTWLDYDGDGDLDLFLGGPTGPDEVMWMYRNDAGTFTIVGISLPDVILGFIAWADYDGDGDLDFAYTGRNESEDLTRVYRNDGGSFVDAEVGLPGLSGGRLAWGDYDGDGDPDLAVSGDLAPFEPTAYITRVYRNDEGAFTDTGAGLPDVAAAIAWGDYDGDGDPDLALAGVIRHPTPDQSGIYITRVYRNDGGAFVDAEAGLTGLSGHALEWGDHDRDGDLDLIVSGDTTFGPCFTQLYRSDGGRTNVPPSAPTGLMATASGELVTLAWDAAGDDTTPVSALTYNVYVEAPDGSRFAVAPMALAAGTPAEPGSAGDGWRLLPATGNAGTRRSYTVRLQPEQTYRWSVQAVDAGLAGSAFAPAATFTTGPVAAEPSAPSGALVLEGPAPNPVRGAAALQYLVPEPGHVRLAVYDGLGREVAIVVDRVLAAGRHEATLDGVALVPGIYLVHLTGPGGVASRTVTVAH